MSEELKPCPVCGSPAEIIDVSDRYYDGTAFYVGCSRCTIRGDEHDRSRDAVREWNALPRRLRFSKEKPTTPDFYWNRDGGLLRVGEILEISGALWCHFAGEHEPQLLELVGGEWARIPEPSEEAI